MLSSFADAPNDCTAAANGICSRFVFWLFLFRNRPHLIKIALEDRGIWHVLCRFGQL
jgi:hypothetical protein